MISKKEINKIMQDASKRIDDFVNDEKELLLSKLTIIFQRAVNITKKYLGQEDKKIEPTQQEKNVFTDIIAESIKGVSEDYKQELNTSLNIGLSQSETKNELLQRVDNILMGDNPTKLKYKNRLNLIVRTESSRIFNAASFKTAKQLNTKYKYLIGVNDNRQAKDSEVALQKYGSPEKAIPIEDYFEYYWSGQLRRFLFPPDRVNDRSSVIYTYERPQ